MGETVKEILPKNKGGRPSKYNPKYCEEIIEFFDEKPYRVEYVEVTTAMGSTYKKRNIIPNDLKFLVDFADKIKVSYVTITRWCKEHIEFCNAYKEAKELQERKLVVNGLNGSWQASFAIFTAKNILGWRDKVDIDHGVTDGYFEKYKGVTDGELEGRFQSICGRN